MRITLLRMIMPNSAMVPSIATKPNGWRNSIKKMATPMMPNGAVKKTIRVWEKLRSCSINTVNTASRNKGMPAITLL